MVRAVRSARWRGVVGGASLGLLAAMAGCGSTPPPPADPAVVAANEQRLLAPFATPRVVIAADLSVEMTANFYDELSRPAVLAGIQDEAHRELPDGGSEVAYRTASQAPLRFQLGGTDFHVLRSARIVVLGGRSDMTLAVEATGGVNVVEGDRRQDFESLRFAGGRTEPTGSAARPVRE